MTSICFLFLTGLFAAAYDDKMEWLIVKGVASDRDLSQPVSDDWKYFASTMAASLVANILSNPIVFKEWPHHNQGKCFFFLCFFLLEIKKKVCTSGEASHLSESKRSCSVICYYVTFLHVCIQYVSSC